MKVFIGNTLKPWVFFGDTPLTDGTSDGAIHPLGDRKKSLNLCLIIALEFIDRSRIVFFKYFKYSKILNVICLLNPKFDIPVSIQNRWCVCKVWPG
jgi:hypothetical protein